MTETATIQQQGGSQAGAGAAAGGADPVTAIANAVGQIYNTYGKAIDLFKVKAERKNIIQQWLRENTPAYRDVFGEWRTEKDTTNIKIIVVLGIIIVVFAGLIVYKKSKRNE